MHTEEVLLPTPPPPPNPPAAPPPESTDTLVVAGMAMLVAALLLGLLDALSTYERVLRKRRQQVEASGLASGASEDDKGSVSEAMHLNPSEWEEYGHGQGLRDGEGRRYGEQDDEEEALLMHSAWPAMDATRHEHVQGMHSPPRQHPLPHFGLESIFEHALHTSSSQENKTSRRALAMGGSVFEPFFEQPLRASSSPESKTARRAVAMGESNIWSLQDSSRGAESKTARFSPELDQTRHASRHWSEQLLRLQCTDKKRSDQLLASSRDPFPTRRELRQLPQQLASSRISAQAMHSPSDEVMSTPLQQDLGFGAILQPSIFEQPLHASSSAESKTARRALAMGDSVFEQPLHASSSQESRTARRALAMGDPDGGHGAIFERPLHTASSAESKTARRALAMGESVFEQPPHASSSPQSAAARRALAMGNDHASYSWYARPPGVPLCTIS